MPDDIVAVRRVDDGFTALCRGTGLRCGEDLRQRLQAIFVREIDAAGVASLRFIERGW